MLHHRALHPHLSLAAVQGHAPLQGQHREPQSPKARHALRRAWPPAAPAGAATCGTGASAVRRGAASVESGCSSNAPMPGGDSGTAPRAADVGALGGTAAAPPRQGLAGRLCNAPRVLGDGRGLLAAGPGPGPCTRLGCGPSPAPALAAARRCMHLSAPACQRTQLVLTAGPYCWSLLVGSKALAHAAHTLSRHHLRMHHIADAARWLGCAGSTSACTMRAHACPACPAQPSTQAQKPT